MTILHEENKMWHGGVVSAAVVVLSCRRLVTRPAAFLFTVCEIDEPTRLNAIIAY
jgi:hypothetical protein